MKNKEDILFDVTTLKIRDIVNYLLMTMEIILLSRARLEVKISIRKTVT